MFQKDLHDSEVAPPEAGGPGWPLGCQAWQKFKTKPGRTGQTKHGKLTGKKDTNETGPSGPDINQKQSQELHQQCKMDVVM